jgi:hypothetical protein
MVDRADPGFLGAAWCFGDFCRQLNAGSVYLQSVLKTWKLERGHCWILFVGAAVLTSRISFYKRGRESYPKGMKTLTRVVVVVFVSLCLMLKAHAQGSAGLSGVVKDTKGQPLRGAEIRIQGSDANKIGKIHTKSDGRYSYPALEDGTYSVTLVVDGVTKAFITNVRTKAGENQTLNFELINSAARPYADGKHYVWVPLQTGTHLGDWMEVENDGKVISSGMAERLNNQGNALVRQIQDRNPPSGQP